MLPFYSFIANRRNMDLSRKSTRVQLELQSKAMVRLSTLKEKTEATSYAEVIKNALRLYEFIVDAEREGCAVLAQRPDGRTRALQIF